MKCLSCQRKGTRFVKKICPGCTSDGVTREDIVTLKKKITFKGHDASPEAGKYVNELQRDHCVSHINFRVLESGPSGLTIEVKWLQYEHKSGEAHGREKANKSK